MGGRGLERDGRTRRVARQNKQNTILRKAYDEQDIKKNVDRFISDSFGFRGALRAGSDLPYERPLRARRGSSLPARRYRSAIRSTVVPASRPESGAGSAPAARSSNSAARIRPRDSDRRRTRIPDRRRPRDSGRGDGKMRRSPLLHRGRLRALRLQLPDS